MSNINATSLEFYGWTLAMLFIFIPPLIVYGIVNMINSGLENKRGISFFIGLIPGNLISCWYLHYSVGFINSLMIFFVCEIVQIIFIIIFTRLVLSFFGRNSFKN